MRHISYAALTAVGMMACTSAHAWDYKIGNQTLSFHGFASQGVIASSDYNYLGHSNDGSFEFNEFGLNASISPFNRTRISVQGFMFDVGNVGNYNPFLDYASIEYTFNDHIGIRGGRVRRPGGIYNHIQDVDLARTSILLPQGMYDARWRDFSTSIDGVVVFGNTSLGKVGGLSYEVYGGYMELSDEGGVAKQIQNGLPPAPIGSFDSLERNPVIGAQLWWQTPVDGLRAGASYGYLMDFTYNFAVNPPFGAGAMSSESNIPYQQYSLEYAWKNWTFQAEYYTYVVNSRTYVGNVNVARGKSHPDSWYVGAAYRFNKWFEAGTYYSEFYGNIDNRNGTGAAVSSDAYQKDLALSLRFDVKDWWILKLEGHRIQGTGQLNNASLNPVRDERTWYMLAAKTTFSF
ncbi:MAG TPA: hypothetical protein VGH19_09910 [Verrucomicrobiae bacterium]